MGFIGWFLLMGRNGLRVGDWVEIDGVVGEVVEIGLLRTVLLETGNWTDSGHPTGRKVAFVNSFAIEGHFFNFSTTGQWLWDEVEILVPASQDPYPVIDAIQKMVTEQTQANVVAAEQEWQRAASRYRAQPVSAAPAVSLRPTSAGIEVHVRYITRAGERVHDYLGSESGHFFDAPCLLLGLLTVLAVVGTVLVWQRREHRGPAMVLGLSLGMMLAAAAAAGTGALLVRLRYGALNFDAVPLSGKPSVAYVTQAPPVFFCLDLTQVAVTLMWPAGIAALVYALLAAADARDDLGVLPVADRPSSALPMEPGAPEAAVS